jgi:hypothetical protein
MSKIEVDAIDKQSGSTLTLGGSGTAVTLASGATQSGFGRTGTVDWQTSIKTSTFTAVNGEGYFVNTTSGAITVNLPAGTAGSIVAFRDYASTFDDNNLVLNPNGSQKIENSTEDFNIQGENESLTLVYADDTKGWLVVNDGNRDAGASTAFISATGGTITTVCTNFKVHTFTGPGTFSVTQGSGPVAVVDYLVVAGGGGAGGGEGTGAGGAGGYRESSGASSGCYSASPLGSGVSSLPISPGCHAVTVGSGGSGHPESNPQQGASGSTSVFQSITSAGGGGGGGGGGSTITDGSGLSGGSGGGGGGRAGPAPGGTRLGGNGNTPSVSPSQGNPGGPSTTSAATPSIDAGGGGGGATAAGTAGSSAPAGGNGGAGATSSINGTPTARAGGGAGASQVGPGGSAGSGGGGAAGSASPVSPPQAGSGSNGTANTGGGAGSSGGGGDGANGGSGVVIIRYRFQ